MAEGIRVTAITGWCGERGEHANCDGTMRAQTGWNWFCTCSCHPEPTVREAWMQPAIDFWRKHRKAVPVDG